MRALVANCGSTSVKLSVVDPIGATQTLESVDDALIAARDVDVVVHRIVHGGDRAAPAAIDDALLTELRALSDLAPLHQPPALDLVERFARALPDTPQFAVFDTAFHRTLPAAASTYALPERWRSRVRGFGFHGISHSWASRRVADRVPGVGRVVVAHLGGGASLCAVRDGRSVMTSMGFTPLDGLVMATRAGALDPGAVVWMDRHGDEDLLQTLERESGLLGLCGDDDMREVLRRCDDGDADAVLAVDVYLHRLVASIGAHVACLGGLDAIVYTGGVGEHCGRIRDLVAERLEWLGASIVDRDVDVDAEVEELTAPGASVRTFVVRAREDLEMVRLVTAMLHATG